MTYNQLPFYVKLGVRLVVVLLVLSLVYVSKEIIVPVYFSVLLSILLLPFTSFMEKKGIPRAPANLAAIILALAFIGLIIYFLSSQISFFLRDVPSIKAHLGMHFNHFQQWINDKMHISFQQQTVILENAKAEVKSSGGEYIGDTFSSLTSVLFVTILVSIYSFLILYYRHMLTAFLYQVFDKKHNERIGEILVESKHVVKKYMTGLLIEMAIVASANSLVLLCLGIKYAIFLGVFAALLNIIPYIGIFSATIFTVLVTLTTSSRMSDIVWIIISMICIHFVDSNFLMPKIVGSKVKINALVTIIGVVVGGSLIGLSGIFLALPTIAILKIIFDRVEGMKPWGTLMGDDITGTKPGRLYGKLNKIRTKSRTKKPVLKIAP